MQLICIECLQVQIAIGLLSDNFNYNTKPNIWIFSTEKVKWVDYVRWFISKNQEFTPEQYGRWIQILEKDANQKTNPVIQVTPVLG